VIVVEPVPDLSEPRGGAASTRKRLLVRMPNWIGDGVMATPAVFALARALPGWTIALQATPRTWSLWQGVEEPFELLPPLRLGERRSHLVREARRLRERRFDAALVLPPSFSSMLLPALAGIPVRVGWSSELRRILTTHPVPGRTRTRHLRDQYHELAEAAARTLGGAALEPSGETRLPLTVEEITRADLWWIRSGMRPERTIALAPGATYGETKRWPAERFRELGARLVEDGWQLLWIGGEAERELAGALSQTFDAGQSRSTAGQWDLRTTLANLARVRGAVSNDSGALHLAQAAGVPVVGIYGSTSPTWTGPVGDAQRVVYDAIDCSPCFAKDCPTAIECLAGIDVARVHRVLTELVGAPDEKRPRGRPAVFLDRDGTILEPVPYIHDPAQVALIPGAGEALRSLHAAGFALVLVTNQSAVARKIVDREQLRRVHERMEALLAEEGAALDAIEICPHHPDFTGPCLCRKPEPGMIRRAAHRLGLDLSRSFLMGDAISDLEAGRRAGVTPLLVRTGYGRDSESSLGAWMTSASASSNEGSGRSEASRALSEDAAGRSEPASARPEERGEPSGAGRPAREEASSSESSAARSEALASSDSPSVENLGGSVFVFDSIREAAVWMLAQT